MKRLFVLLMLSALVLTGCQIVTEDELAAKWEEGYAQGKEEGYDLGYTEGVSEGFNEGNRLGYDEGYNLGYDEGHYDGSNGIPLPDDWEDPGALADERAAESTSSSDSSEVIVYVTDTGTKYHRDGCNSLWNSKYERTLSEAKSEGYSPCMKCNPPT